MAMMLPLELYREIVYHIISVRRTLVEWTEETRTLLQLCAVSRSMRLETMPVLYNHIDFAFGMPVQVAGSRGLLYSGSRIDRFERTLESNPALGSLVRSFTIQLSDSSLINPGKIRSILSHLPNLRRLTVWKARLFDITPCPAWIPDDAPNLEEFRTDFTSNQCTLAAISSKSPKLHFLFNRVVMSHNLVQDFPHLTSLDVSYDSIPSVEVGPWRTISHLSLSFLLHQGMDLPSLPLLVSFRIRITGFEPNALTELFDFLLVVAERNPNIRYLQIDNQQGYIDPSDTYKIPNRFPDLWARLERLVWSVKFWQKLWATLVDNPVNFGLLLQKEIPLVKELVVKISSGVFCVHRRCVPMDDFVVEEFRGRFVVDEDAWRFATEDLSRPIIVKEWA